MRRCTYTLNVVLGVALTAALAVTGFTHDAAEFADGGARSWTGGGCPEVAAPDVVPARVVVVPAHFYAEAAAVSLDEAWSLNHDASDANDVCVVAFR